MSRPASPKRLIVTADDFGLSPEVNAAVTRAYREGILTTASLMVGAPAAADAVRVARENPGLRVGLHLVLVEGRAVLPPEKIPGIVDSRGRFSDNPATAGTRYFFSPALRRQVAAECRAQLEAFRATGLALDHLNGHNHLHIHPFILDTVLGLAREFRIRALRNPRQALDGLRPADLAAAALIGPWAGRMRRRLLRAGLRCNDAIFGLFETGAMVEAAWLGLIPRLREGVTEVYCHPALATVGVLRETMPDYRHAEELAALLSPRVRAALETAGVQRIAFSDLKS